MLKEENKTFNPNKAVDDFNEKWFEFLAEGHYGLDIWCENPKLYEYLDKEFEQLTKIPEFKYYQIKLKFNMARFYADGISTDKMFELEDNINRLCKNG